MFKCGDCAASVHASVFDCCINHCTCCSGLLNIQYVIRVLGLLNLNRDIAGYARVMKLKYLKFIQVQRELEMHQNNGAYFLGHYPIEWLFQHLF